MCYLNYSAIWGSNLDASERKGRALIVRARNEKRDGNVEDG